MDADAELRRKLVRALEDASVIAIFEEPVRGPFLAGEGDIAFAALDMDSLAVMEFCISVELSTGVSITPDQLRSFETVGAVRALILANKGA